MVKSAAEDLYRALAAACTIHAEHQTHFSLKPVWKGSTPHICFSIAFRQRVAGENAGRGHQTLWLNVESVVAGSIRNATPNGLEKLSAIPQITKRRRDSPPPPTFELEKKRPRRVLLRSPALAAPVNPPLGPMLQNLCTQSNFCNQLQNVLAQPSVGPKPEHCIGFLECTAHSKHLVYVHNQPPSASSGRRDTLMSLMELLSACQEQVYAGEPTFSPFERVRLAKELATAVLQFHATPWLKGSWSSSDVFLHRVDPETFQAISHINEPYLNVSVKGLDGTISGAPTMQNRTLIRNSFLFGLGVMLLELAHEAPLRSLRKAADAAANDQNAEYYTADRVRLSVSRLLGGRYAEVARKCIQCDFGRGSDLNDVSLQECFYRDVVCELEELERKLREFGLGT
jgi:hypothetical protein